MTDLVCASSACPDDIDPANAWIPTDIHVRVYPAERRFSMAVAHRVTPDSEPKLTKETGFHPRWSQLTRQVTEYRGYWLPTSFDNHGAIDEYWACREGAVVMDLSPLRKFEVVGRTRRRCCRPRSPATSASSPPARWSTRPCATRPAACSTTRRSSGSAPDRFRFVGGDEYDGTWLRQLAGRLGLDQVWVKHSTDQLHNIAVQGPSRGICSGSWCGPRRPSPTSATLTWFRFAIGRVGGPEGLPMIVSRTGYSGELGYELWCHPKDAPVLWDAVWEAGQPHGLTPLGLDALDMLRIEAGLIFAGYEFSDQVDPFEAGIGFTVAAEDQGGRLRRPGGAGAAQGPPQRTLVGLELAGNEPGRRTATACMSGRSQVGVITSGTRSPILRNNIALCRMAVEYSETRHRGRGRQAGRAPEAHPRARRPVPVLRPGQDPPAFLTDGRARSPWPRLCRPPGMAVPYANLPSVGWAALRDSVRPRRSLGALHGSPPRCASPAG